LIRRRRGSVDDKAEETEMDLFPGVRAVIRLTGSLLAFALLAAGNAGAQEPIRIGSFLSVTGPAAFLGDP
jgi:hypothetical protein